MTKSQILRALALLLMAPVSAVSLSGCIVAGVSSTGGFFLWPGGLILVVILLIVVFMMRGRR